jgi:hypothetical protein
MPIGIRVSHLPERRRPKHAAGTGDKQRQVQHRRFVVSVAVMATIGAFLIPVAIATHIVVAVAVGAFILQLMAN